MRGFISRLTKSALLLSILLHCITVSVHAETPTSGSCGANAFWSYDAATQTLTISGTGRMHDYVAWENPYEKWDHPWRFYNSDITKVVVKGTVEHIADYAFFRLFQVTEIIIEEGVKSAGRNALQNTLVESLDLPDSIESMGIVSLGSSHNLASLELPASLQVISPFLVTDCPALKTIYVGDKVTEVDEAGFANLDNATVYFTGDAPKFHEESFRYARAMVCYPKDNPTWTEEVRQQYAGNLIWVACDPDYPDHAINSGENPPEFGDGWLYYEEAGELIIYDGCDPDQIREYITGDYWPELRSFIIEDGMTVIPDAMFAGKADLESVQLGASVT